MDLSQHIRSIHEDDHGLLECDKSHVFGFQESIDFVGMGSDEGETIEWGLAGVEAMMGSAQDVIE